MHNQNIPFQQVFSFIILSASIIIAFIAFKKDNEGSSSSSNDTDSETKDEAVEKMEGGTIMNTALPTLTNIFSSITKKD